MLYMGDGVTYLYGITASGNHVSGRTRRLERQLKDIPVITAPEALAEPLDSW